ncbi:hypothetical protein GCM10023148_25470 [Actinokineospora soli]
MPHGLRVVVVVVVVVGGGGGGGSCVVVVVTGARVVVVVVVVAEVVVVELLADVLDVEEDVGAAAEVAEISVPGAAVDWTVGWLPGFCIPGPSGSALNRVPACTPSRNSAAAAAPMSAPTATRPAAATGDPFPPFCEQISPTGGIRGVTLASPFRVVRKCFASDSSPGLACGNTREEVVQK